MNDKTYFCRGCEELIEWDDFNPETNLCIYCDQLFGEEIFGDVKEKE